jgi:hypothetical protein
MSLEQTLAPKIRGMFPDGFTSLDEMDAFGQCDRPEEIAAWTD